MSTTSPNMSLVIPTVGSTIGPDYAFLINADLASLDAHDHTPGKGVQITPAGLNINTDLAMNNHFLINAAGISLASQSVSPGLGTVYQSGVDLYYNDGTGAVIRLTQSGAVAGAPGSITNLTPPASVTYVSASKTFVFQSNIGASANLDASSLVMRNITPNSTFALTLSPPAGLSANYTLVLPASIPAAQSFMTLDNAGQMASPWTVDNNTIKIVSNQLVAQASAITTSREHAWELNGNYTRLSFPVNNIDSVFIAPVNINIQSVWIYISVPGNVVGSSTVFDLKVSNPQSGSWTSILSTPGSVTQTVLGVLTDTYTDSGTVIPPISGVVKPVIGTALITAGQALRFDLLSGMQGTSTLDARIRIYYTLA